MDLQFSPSILDTPSLITPNINTNPLIFKSAYATAMDTNNDDNNTSSNNNNTSSNPSSTTTTTTADESSSAEIKLSKIEDDLKQSFTQKRAPTESLFAQMAKAGVLTIEKPITNDDNIIPEIPTTADVMNVLESFAKNLTKDNTEREITTTTFTIENNNNRLDSSSPTQAGAMGVIVSPKKKLLIRSQSHTEPTSPTNNYSQTQKLNIDEENSIDEQQFQRLQDLPLISHTIETNTQVENNHIKPTFSLQIQPNTTIVKQQQPIIINNNKRSFQQANIGISIPKANSILIPQNEVTSTGQISSVKRQKVSPIPTANTSLRSSTSNDSITTDDNRKKQIRDSNREAARRCRERRRQYIEQLEGNLEQCKLQIKQLNDKLAHAERENTQLRAVITEAKIFQTSGRLPANESIVEFITTTNGMDINSKTNDGNTLQRNYIHRNTH